MYKTIEFEIEHGVARIILNRPDKLNAMNASMLEEMLDALSKIESNGDIRILVMSGKGRAFSAGVDLKETSSKDFNSDHGVIQLGLKFADKIISLPVVTIAQIHGYCFTGALELALLFDLIYCASDTLFGDTHAKWAIMPRWGMTQRLSRRVGLHKAKELTFRAMRIDGTEAQRVGLVNQAFELADLDKQIKIVIDDIILNDHEAIMGIKLLYDKGFNGTLSDGLNLELSADPRLSSTSKTIGQFDKIKGR